LNCPNNCILIHASESQGFPWLFPFSWEQRKLSDVLVEYLEQCEKNGLYEHVSLTKEGVVPKSARYDRDSLVQHEDKKYRVTHVDDICYNPANLKFGVICRNAYGDGIFSPIYITFHVAPIAYPKFIEHYVRRESFILSALLMQEGTVYERMAVKPQDLLNMQMQLPTLREQALIGDTICALDSLITLHQREHAMGDNVRSAQRRQGPHNQINILIFQFMNNVKIRFLCGRHTGMAKSPGYTSN